MQSSPDLLQPGSRVREYEIIERIARGGMGAVYRARHVYLEEERAIKVILPGSSEAASTIERFIREARILVRLRHPNLVQLHEFGTLDDGSFFMVLELIRGESVLARITRLRRIPVVDAIRIVSEAAMGLAVAHAQGIVHRDIAPDNLLLVSAGGRSEITKVIDFGIAKPVSEDSGPLNLTTNMYIGKPQYSSPEQCGVLKPGQTIDGRSDIYSLGITFYHMVTGGLPFEASNPIGYLFKHVNETPPPPSSRFPEGDLPPQLDALIMRTLSKRREDRQSSMNDLIEELDALARSLSMGAQSVGSWGPEREATLGSGEDGEPGIRTPPPLRPAQTPGQTPFPVDREVLVHRLMLERKYSQAIKILTPLVETDPGNPQWRKLLETARGDKAMKDIRRARRLIKANSLEAAGSILVQLEADSTLPARITAQVERLRASLGRAAEASRGAPSETAADVEVGHPEDSAARTIVKLLDEVALLHRKGLHQEALERVNAVIKSDPENERAHELEISITVAIEARDLAQRINAGVTEIVGFFCTERISMVRGAVDSLHSVAADTSSEPEVNALSRELGTLCEAIEADNLGAVPAAVAGLAVRHPLLRPHERALREYASSLEARERQRSFDRLLQEGATALAGENWTQAIRCFEGAVDLRPDDSAARDHLEAARARAEETRRTTNKVRSLLYQIELAAHMQSWDEVMRLAAAGREPELAGQLTAADAARIREVEGQARAARGREVCDRAARLSAAGHTQEALQAWMEAAALVPSDDDIRVMISQTEAQLDAEKTAREQFSEHLAECRRLLTSGRIDAAEEELARCDAVVAPPQLRLDDLRMQLSALRRDVQRRREQEVTRWKLISDFVAASRRLWEAGELEAALEKAQDLLKAVPKQPEATEIVATIQDLLAREAQSRERFGEYTRSFRERLRQGDLLEAEQALLECGSCLAPGLRLGDLQMELAAMRGDLMEAIQRASGSSS